MYVGSFIKCLFTPRKLPSALYFLANQGVVFGVFYFLGTLFDAQHPEHWGAFGIAANLITMIAMLSPFGEAVVRYRENASAVSATQYPVTCRLFENICTTARSVNKRLPQDIRLYQMPGNDVNAAATGHHTVIVTEALLSLVESGKVPPQQFKAVIAHELGHVAFVGHCSIRRTDSTCFVRIRFCYQSFFAPVGVSFAYPWDNILCRVWKVRNLFVRLLVETGNCAYKRNFSQGRVRRR